VREPEGGRDRVELELIMESARVGKAGVGNGVAARERETVEVDERSGIRDRLTLGRSVEGLGSSVTQLDWITEVCTEWSFCVLLVLVRSCPVILLEGVIVPSMSWHEEGGLNVLQEDWTVA